MENFQVVLCWGSLFFLEFCLQRKLAFLPIFFADTFKRANGHWGALEDGFNWTLLDPTGPNWTLLLQLELPLPPPLPLRLPLRLLLLLLLLLLVLVLVLVLLLLLLVLLLLLALPDTL